MKILHIFNQYRGEGGEDQVIAHTLDLLKKKGHCAELWMRSSRGLENSMRLKIKAFFGGIYSIYGQKEMLSLLRKDRPDLVHVHNLYPLFSPSILVACKQESVPVVMTVHNYGLTCPIGLHLYKKRVCWKCLDGSEYWCVLRNCARGPCKSLGYALRSAVARICGLFRNNITFFIAPSRSVGNYLAKAGIPASQIVTIPNMVPEFDFSTNHSTCDYAAFAGRITPEKGVDILLSAARLSNIPLRVAGTGPLLPQVAAKAPDNMLFVGLLSREEMALFYRQARFVVAPSICDEAFGLVAAEAMGHGLPVIASRVGGLSELVEDAVTGFLFESGNSADLAFKMKQLWESPELCRKMGQAGLQKALREYGEETYYSRLENVYRRVVAEGACENKDSVVLKG